MNPIHSLLTPSLPSLPTLGGTHAAESAAPFKDFLLDSIQQVNQMQQEANQAVEQLATGGEVSPAEVLTAVQKADLAFKMMIQVRNKLVDAYNEVQAMRV
ncbi:MAG: flagellar hook-basal body complex protein FliE [Pirellulales bacterium]|nr:flagellar hook-basal body complex protein FliE [Pirellulales bacterium]